MLRAGGRRLMGDDEEFARLNLGTGQVVPRLERFERHPEPLGNFFQGIADTHTIPTRRISFCSTIGYFGRDRKRRELVGGHSINQLSNLAAGSNRHFEMVNGIIRRGGITP